MVEVERCFTTGHHGQATDATVELRRESSAERPRAAVRRKLVLPSAQQNAVQARGHNGPHLQGVELRRLPRELQPRSADPEGHPSRAAGHNENQSEKNCG